MSAPSMLGSGLYFIDVLACLLFSLALALVGARFGREHSVVIDAPGLEPRSAAGPELSGASLQVRSRDGRTEILWEDQALAFDELAERLRAAPPPSLVVRAADSELARVIALAHAAGVHDIELAYELAPARPRDPAGAVEKQSP